MDAIRNVLLILVLFFKQVQEGDCNCVLSLEKDFGNPSPVYLQNGDYLAPTSSGDVKIRRAAKVTVACPGDKRFVVLGNDTTEFQEVEAICVSNKTFQVGRWKGVFKDIKCNGPPWFISEDTQSCHGGNKLYRVGYKIRSTFHAVYEMCFNQGLVTTLYVKHRLTPANKFVQGGNRPQFIEGGLFGKVRMSQLYKSKNQKARFNEVLGAGMDREYITKNEFLTRGHLAPRADFPLRAEQRATFHYGNTAPQWMRNNAGDWAALEDGLRRRVHALNSSVTVFTGTLGVLALQDKQGRDTEVYLTADANNNGIVPVPLYFYKLVYDPRRKAATAFITINSSFYNSSTTEKLTFCTDVCDTAHAWLKWRADGAHSFCCDYPQFVKTVGYLPKLDVRELFY